MEIFYFVSCIRLLLNRFAFAVKPIFYFIRWNAAMKTAEIEISETDNCVVNVCVRLKKEKQKEEKKTRGLSFNYSL